MTPQIKKRIEQIRQGEVPEGYKRTKVGIVPEEWETKNLANYMPERNDVKLIQMNNFFLITADPVE